MQKKLSPKDSLAPSSFNYFSRSSAAISEGVCGRFGRYPSLPKRPCILIILRRRALQRELRDSGDDEAPSDLALIPALIDTHTAATRSH